MSAAAIRDALVLLVKTASGTDNVYGEDDFEPSAVEGEKKKKDGRALHWWTVSLDPLEHAEGCGWHEPRHRVKIMGFHGVDRAVAEGGNSDTKFRSYVAAVLDALTAPAGRAPGGCMDTTTPRSGSVTQGSRTVGGRAVLCHSVAIEYEAQEE